MLSAVEPFIEEQLAPRLGPIQTPLHEPPLRLIARKDSKVNIGVRIGRARR
jgi:hypothetical protein